MVNSKYGRRGKCMTRHGLRAIKGSKSVYWFSHRLGIGGIYVEFVDTMKYRLIVKELGIDEEIGNTTMMNRRLEGIGKIEARESERIRLIMQWL